MHHNRISITSVVAELTTETNIDRLLSSCEITIPDIHWLTDKEVYADIIISIDKEGLIIDHMDLVKRDPEGLKITLYHIDSKSSVQATFEFIKPRITSIILNKPTQTNDDDDFYDDEYICRSSISINVAYWGLTKLHD